MSQAQLMAAARCGRAVARNARAAGGRGASRQVSTITGGAAMVAAYLVVAVTVATWTVLVAGALLGISFALFHSTFQTWATQLVPAARGAVTSLFVSAVFTGAAVASAWASGLETRHAFGTLFAVAAALAGAVGVAGTIARLRSHPSAGAQPGRTDDVAVLIERRAARDARG